ncbi:MAG: hypothetical protein K0M64_04420 [Rhizobium sp.]|nr:hypothetical protein [Rhizobium sp.]
MQLNRIALAVSLATLATVASPTALAYKLSPEGTEEQRRMANIRGNWITKLELFAANNGVQHFTDAVHEEITNRMFGCDGGKDECGGAESVRAPTAVLAGVRWNDDPAFRLHSGQGAHTACKVTDTIRFQMQPRCWYQLFEDAKTRAAQGEQFDEASGAALLYRTHFGDLQPLHAMAAKDGDPAQVTQAQVMAWVEFTWRVAIGEIALDDPVRERMPGGLSHAFTRTGWSVQDLFTQGAPGLRRHIREVAFGSLLHTPQDSYAGGHAERSSPSLSRSCELAGRRVVAPGRISEFYSYGQQDAALHGGSDARSALAVSLQEEGDIVEVGRPLVTAFDSKAPWETVKPYFECLFELAPDARPASAADAYRLAGSR